MKTILLIGMVYFLMASTAISVAAQSDTYIQLDIVTELQMETPSSVKWSSDSAKLAVVVWPDIQIWDAQQWKSLVTIRDAFVYTFDWHPQDQILAGVLGGRAENLLIWDATTGELLRQIIRPAPPETIGVIVVDGVAWHPSGERIVTGSVFDTLLVWDLTAKDVPYSPFSSTLVENDSHVTYEIAWSSDGQTLLASGSDTYRVWDMASRNEIFAVDGCCYFAWNPQKNEQFIGLSSTGQVHVWNTRTTDSVMTFEKGWDARSTFAWSPDGRLIAATGYPASNLKIWDAETGTSYAIWGQITTGVENVIWRPDNRQIAIVYENGIIIYDYEIINP